MRFNMPCLRSSSEIAGVLPKGYPRSENFGLINVL